jgi:hypothetical protein
MYVYRITNWGRKIARSINTPRTPEWRIIYALDRSGQASSEQLAASTGLSEQEVRMVAGRLKRKRSQRGEPIIEEA